MAPPPKAAGNLAMVAASAIHLDIEKFLHPDTTTLVVVEDERVRCVGSPAVHINDRELLGEPAKLRQDPELILFSRLSLPYPRRRRSHPRTLPDRGCYYQQAS